MHKIIQKSHAKKDTRLFLVLANNEKISEAPRNGLWSNLLQIQTTPVIDLGIRNAFLQFLAELACSLNTVTRHHNGC